MTSETVTILKRWSEIPEETIFWSSEDVLKLRALNADVKHSSFNRTIVIIKGMIPIKRIYEVLGDLDFDYLTNIESEGYFSRIPEQK